MLIKFILNYFIVVNILTFASFGLDKYFSTHDYKRIPESALLIMSAIGGAIGGLCAMYIFRHKTRKAKFFITLPLLSILHIIIAWLIIF